VAACHAGWRGVAGRILAAAVTMLEAGGSRPADLLVALGPAVSGALYQVERAVSEQVAAGLDVDAAAGLSALREAGALLDDPHPGRDRLDIRAAARLQLRGLGVPDAQISVCPLCTVSELDLFHSWRRDQVKAVQWSGIVSQA
ncbi:MAG: laccase domain-containing protein, partial [Prochlorococcaceae cyanobacterium]